MAFFVLRALVVFTAAFLVNADIRSDLTGKGFTVLFPGDSGYSTASQAYNLRFTFQPAAIAYPVNSQQVSTVIKAGSANNLRVVARSGGHSYIANGLGGQNNVVVVDMKNFNTVTVDSSTSTAVIGTGTRLGNVALALNSQGRALPHGTCPYVGVGGHSGYGGFGFSSRMWGLTLDNIISVNVVLADGTITTASATTNPDLFWALRGSSGSFGITTAIQVKTYAAPSSVTVFTYNWDLTASAAASALGAYQTFAQSSVPAQLGMEVVLGKGSSSGRVSFEITGGWYGAADQCSGAIAPLLNSLPSPQSSSVKPGSYIDSVSAFSFADSLDTTTAPDTHDTFYAKSLMTPQASPISASALSSFMSYLGSSGFSTSTNWFIQFELWGAPNSAINAVSLDSTAFPHRSSMFSVQFYASSSNYNPPFPASGLTFVDGAVSAIVNNSPSGWDYGAYINYVDDRLQDWQQRYYGSAYSRLTTLKTTYDSNGVFSFPTGIQSSSGSGSGGGNTSTTVAIHPNGNANNVWMLRCCLC
ncbi:glucooligosaccharide oxidase [Cyathus striatus]|nr:glucooligosaccharide oxidase [Cyathus striatus]